MYPGMPTEKIRGLLIEKKVKQTDIARDLNLTTGSVSRVISRHYKSRRVMEEIAHRTHTAFEKMWGEAA